MTTGFPVSCQCGHITFTTPSRTPSGMAYCHCTDCRKQSASAFGTSVYFPAEQVFPLPEDLESKLAVYKRTTDSGNTMHAYFCPKCGVRILHAVYGKEDGTLRKVAFKGGCLDGLDWKQNGVKHIFCRSAVVDIPEGAERWEGMPGK